MTRLALAGSYFGLRSTVSYLVRLLLLFSLAFALTLRVAFCSVYLGCFVGCLTALMELVIIILRFSWVRVRVTA